MCEKSGCFKSGVCHPSTLWLVARFPLPWK
nr:MAG TPA: hypothetical protein [Caudoviricetes sp.]